jgi:hypothetical protein
LIIGGPPESGVFMRRSSPGAPGLPKERTLEPSNPRTLGPLKHILTRHSTPPGVKPSRGSASLGGFPKRGLKGDVIASQAKQSRPPGLRPHPPETFCRPKSFSKRAPRENLLALRSRRPSVNRFKLGPLPGPQTRIAYKPLRPPSAALRFSKGGSNLGMNRVRRGSTKWAYRSTLSLPRG